MRRRTRDAFSTLSENLDGKERPLAGALQVPVRYVFFVLAALLLLFGAHTYRESTRSRPPDHVVRLLPTSYEDRSRLRRLLSTNRSEVRLGLVTLTQGSRGLGMWLRHHYWHCGVRRVYLQIERGSADLRVLRRAPWTELVRIVPLGQQPVVVRNYAQQMDRQAALMAQAMVRGQKDGLSHLMTIDDDELLFCPAGCAALHAALAAAPEPVLVLHNLEALAPAADQLVTDWRARGVASFFGRSVAFRHNTSSYAGYRHGKAVGALRRGLKPAGCCRFSRRQGQQLPDVPLPGYVAVLLHYESPSFGAWRAKFGPMAAAHPVSDPPGIATLPSYYALSLQAARGLAAARNGSASDRAAATGAARRLWAAWKRAPSGLPAAPRGRGAARELLNLGITLLRPLRGPRYARSAGDDVVDDPADDEGEIANPRQA